MASSTTVMCLVHQMDHVMLYKGSSEPAAPPTHHGMMEKIALTGTCKALYGPFEWTRHMKLKEDTIGCRSDVPDQTFLQATPLLMLSRDHGSSHWSDALQRS